jgi:WD40 repeat protein
LDFKGYGPSGSPLISTLESHLSGINAVSFTPDRKYLVSTSDDNTLKVWDPKTGKEVHTQRGHLRGVLQPVAQIFLHDPAYLAIVMQIIRKIKVKNKPIKI